jgi:uncharacterized membrane protein YfcA
LDLFAIAIIGFFVGLTGGMFGIGGSVILIPALTEFRGPDQHLYQATAMIMNFFVSFPAVFQHWRARAIEFTTIARIFPLSIAFVAIGVALSESRLFAGSEEANLRGLFGIFLFACGLVEIYRAYRPRTVETLTGKPLTSVHADSSQTKPVHLSWSLITAIAAPTGFISGLLGIGGGILGVPLQRRFLQMPLTIAIANSTALVAATAVFGAVIKNYAYYSEHGSATEPMRLAAILAPTAIAGSLVGARLTHRVPLKLLRNLFVVLLLVAAIRLIHGAISPRH